MVALSQISHPYGNSLRVRGKKGENANLSLSDMKEGTTVGLWLLQLLFHPLFFLSKEDSNSNVWVTHCLPRTFIRVQLISQPSYK